jgi:hypothetical protein
MSAVRLLFTNYTWLSVRAGGPYLLWLSLGCRAQYQFQITHRFALIWHVRGHRLCEWQIGPLRGLHFP